ncbi:PREDICTED: uncharacterized protein LOC105133695 [Populus euphratica]|uniref:Uncharacterized protein LOC105133695 n=1 Tax=Populus euphratica TaxID=75702 RepID=A0AAJ6UV53_POPEU|nr:PREDICTED: uncharacterized protein LOC105133695 [Populus euphratica]
MSMPSSPRPQMLRHPSHIHPLFEFHLPVGGEFICDGCRTCGYEKSYRCTYCNFDLHEYCASCPKKLRSGLHVHELTLVSLVGTRKVCDICEECADGLFYACNVCDFNVHPVCTQIPTKLQHGHLPNHSLTLRQPRMSSRCVVCWDACTSWRYGCDICQVDVHLDCVYEPFYDLQTPPRSSPRSTRANMGPRQFMGGFHGFPMMAPNQGQMGHRAAHNGNQGRRRRNIISAVARLGAQVLFSSVVGVMPFSTGDFWGS